MSLSDVFGQAIRTGQTPHALSCSRMNTAHTHLNASVLAGSSAHGPQQVSNQDTSLKKRELNFFSLLTVPPIFTHKPPRLAMVRLVHQILITH